MTQSADQRNATPERQRPILDEKLDLLKWHLDRYDRRRASTASRASVVLSAGAILSAGNAVILSQLLGAPAARLDGRLAALFGTGLLVSMTLVIVSLIRATGVLVTAKSSRETFPEVRHLPTALLFNDSDTVRENASFVQFQDAVETQDHVAIREAAQVELWIGIQQHRRRYLRLRAATRALRWSAAVFLASLIALTVTILTSGLDGS
ncbi:hypothetical protein [Actinomadura madurae]|uniref:hypothetical protein n=1 Tax=Actinomadura madurae TaxID=1993 RepID=UPI000D89A363|nr:hypothetical protein [Actinomadura madurae]SPT51848.1 Uncharacterised protein [Actinomadura madurae]